jgi:PAS domain S-box-containing protein
MSDCPNLDPLLLEVMSCVVSAPSFHEELLDRLYEGVYFVDRELRIQYWNQNAELLTGYSASEAIGRHCFDNSLMHVNEGPGVVCLKCQLAGTIVDGKRREAEIHLRHKLGHCVSVSIRVAPVVDSAELIVGAVVVFNDTTATKNIERRVSELEKLAFRDALIG